MTRPPNTLNDLISRRHTCRAFLPIPVARSTIESILEAAQRTPSWGNVQPWQVTIVSGDAADTFREAYTRFAQKNEPIAPDFEFPQSYEGVLKDRRRECGWRLYESVGVKKGDREGSARQTLENFRFLALHTWRSSRPTVVSARTVPSTPAPTWRTSSLRHRILE